MVLRIHDHGSGRRYPLNRSQAEIQSLLPRGLGTTPKTTGEPVVVTKRGFRNGGEAVFPVRGKTKSSEFYGRVNFSYCRRHWRSPCGRSINGKVFSCERPIIAGWESKFSPAEKVRDIGRRDILPRHSHSVMAVQRNQATSSVGGLRSRFRQVPIRNGGLAEFRLYLLGTCVAGFSRLFFGSLGHVESVCCANFFANPSNPNSITARSGSGPIQSLQNPYPGRSPVTA